MERLDTEINNALSHVFLLEQPVESGPVPQAHLCCAASKGQTRVFCVHLPLRYMGAMDRCDNIRTSVWIFHLILWESFMMGYEQSYCVSKDDHHGVFTVLL